MPFLAGLFFIIMVIVAFLTSKIVWGLVIILVLQFLAVRPYVNGQLKTKKAVLRYEAILSFLFLSNKEEINRVRFEHYKHFFYEDKETS